MKYVKNSNWPVIVGAITLLGIGLFIGLNINKQEVYIKNDTLANTIDNANKNEIEVVEEPIPEKEDAPAENISKEETVGAAKSNKTDTVAAKEKTKNTPKVEYSNNDQVVINSLENSLSKINSGNKKDKSFADSAKGVFVSIVDFLFYDGEINGVTFDELTESGKEQVLKIANKVDTAIESKIPGYKETISSTASKAFNKASQIIKNGANNINNFAKGKLGEENYQSIIAAKDELVYYTKNAIDFIGDVGGKLFDSLKGKLDGWYQDFKK